MTFAGPDDTARRQAQFREWAASHGLAADGAVRLIEGVLCGARIRLDTGITERGHWPIIVDVTAPLDKKAQLADLVGSPRVPRSLTSIVASRAGARLRFRPTARLEHIEAVIIALPRLETGPYR